MDSQEPTRRTGSFRSKPQAFLDQSWSGHGLRSERIDRNVRVLHQPGPLRCKVKQSEG